MNTCYLLIVIPMLLRRGCVVYMVSAQELSRTLSSFEGRPGRGVAELILLRIYAHPASINSLTLIGFSTDEQVSQAASSTLLYFLSKGLRVAVV